MRGNKTYGLMAEFEDGGQLLRAAGEAHSAGYRKMEGYSPVPVEGLDEALGRKRSILARLVLIGGTIGCVGGFLLQYWVSKIAYPLNIGGKPYNSWPMFIPVTFEMTILFAALTAVIGMFALNGLPRLYHPVFNVERFQGASRDRYFLCIESNDGQFDHRTTKTFLENLGALGVYEVDE